MVLALLLEQHLTVPNDHRRWHVDPADTAATSCLPEPPPWSLCLKEVVDPIGEHQDSKSRACSSDH